ncbi:hypothetical protein BDW22DRAFT_956718 [Trametopsis cervina]|nr:hypothetical protein BDW22DRAFT_956718 [Trametopsis cervina]
MQGRRQGYKTLLVSVFGNWQSPRHTPPVDSESTFVQNNYMHDAVPRCYQPTVTRAARVGRVLFVSLFARVRLFFGGVHAIREEPCAAPGPATHLFLAHSLRHSSHTHPPSSSIAFHPATIAVVQDYSVSITLHPLCHRTPAPCLTDCLEDEYVRRELQRSRPATLEKAASSVELLTQTLRSADPRAIAVRSSTFHGTPVLCSALLLWKTNPLDSRTMHTTARSRLSS